MSLAAALLASRTARTEERFQFRYMIASCMYGGLSLETIVPEVRKTGATHIDIWSSHGKPRPQRDMMKDLGVSQCVRRDLCTP